MRKDYGEEALLLHEKYRGKIGVCSKVPLKTREDLSTFYTPGVAKISLEVSKNKELAYKYTSKWNTVAVVSDGSAVLGLGNIGAEGAIPVMEGKAILFKEFGGVDAFPICIRTQDAQKIIELVENISPVFGAINLEDISAPRCFEISETLQERLDIPVFHDDQHGTAVVVRAAAINVSRVLNKPLEEMKIVVSGAGAAGIAIAKLLKCAGVRKDICTPVKDIIVCDTKGAIFRGRKDNMNKYKEEIAQFSNKGNITGGLAEALEGADIFIGVSAPNVLTKEMIGSMEKDCAVFAMANPIPEISPEEALKAGARIVGTGRSDYPNQINNVLAFPGIFRGALDGRTRVINDEMKLAAAFAIANCVKNPKPNNIMPSALDKKVGKKVAKEVKEAGIESGATR